MTMQWQCTRHASFQAGRSQPSKTTLYANSTEPQMQKMFLFVAECFSFSGTARPDRYPSRTRLLQWLFMAPSDHLTDCHLPVYWKCPWFTHLTCNNSGTVGASTSSLSLLFFVCNGGGEYRPFENKPRTQRTLPARTTRRNYTVLSTN